MVSKIKNLVEQGLEENRFYLDWKGNRINPEDLEFLETRRIERRNAACCWREIETPPLNARFSVMRAVERSDGVLFYTIDYFR